MTHAKPVETLGQALDKEMLLAPPLDWIFCAFSDNITYKVVSSKDAY